MIVAILLFRLMGAPDLQKLRSGSALS